MVSVTVGHEVRMQPVTEALEQDSRPHRKGNWSTRLRTNLLLSKNCTIPSIDRSINRRKFL